MFHLPSVLYLQPYFSTKKSRPILRPLHFIQHQSWENPPSRSADISETLFLLLESGRPHFWGPINPVQTNEEEMHHELRFGTRKEPKRQLERKWRGTKHQGFKAGKQRGMVPRRRAKLERTNNSGRGVGLLSFSGLSLYLPSHFLWVICFGRYRREEHEMMCRYRNT